MKIIEWIKKELFLEAKVGWNNIKLNFFITPLSFLTFIILFVIFRNSLYEHAVVILLTPMLIQLVLSLIYLMPKRNDPNYQIYYLFHLSKISKIIILIGALFLIGLYFYAQCQNYGFGVGAECFKKIFNP